MTVQPNGSKTPGAGGFVFGASKWAGLATCGLVLLLVGFAYRSVVGFEFVWDDRAFYLTATDLRRGDFLSAITAPVLAGTSYFRPLVMGWIALEVRLGDGLPFWPHVANLALHLANVALVGLLSARLMLATGASALRAGLLSSVAMLLYGLHPALIEAVAWISGRFDLTVTFFGLLALWLVTSTSRIAVMLAGLSFLAAALSKEMAATLPLVAFLLVWALRRPGASLREAVLASVRQERLVYIVFGLGAAVYVALRGAFLTSMVLPDSGVLSSLGSTWKHLGFIGITLAFYVKTAIWPFMGMGPLHPFEHASMTATDAAVGIAVLAAAGTFAAVALWRPTRARLLALAALISLLPVLNIVPLTIVGNIGHERFLVLPLALAVLSLVSIDSSRWRLSEIMRHRLPQLAALGAVAWTAIALANLHVTLPLWRSDVPLWLWAYSKHPDSAYAQFSLIAAAVREGRVEIIKDVVAKAEERGPLPLRVSVPYGQYLIRSGQPELGVDKLKQALAGELLPHLEILKAGVALEDAVLNRQQYGGWILIYAYTALAEGQNALRQFKEAEESARIAIFYQRDNPVPHLYKSLALYGQDRWDDAQAEYRLTREMYAPVIASQADAVRNNFLRQLCAMPAKTPQVCARASAEPGFKAPEAR
jgi:tetratricopeptide (TPR) repeat protein